MAVLVDVGDVVDRAVAGELKFVSIKIGSNSNPTCTICGALAGVQGPTLKCSRGHVFGEKYVRAPLGLSRCAEIQWPADAHLVETSWVDEPACAEARVRAIRLSTPSKTNRTPPTARAEAVTLPSRCRAPTLEERSELRHQYFANPRACTTS